MDKLGIRKENDNLRINELRLKEKISQLQEENEALTEIIKCVIDMQKANYGDGISTHMKLHTISKKLLETLEKYNNNKP